jgi:hypothetical protein
MLAYLDGGKFEDFVVSAVLQEERAGRQGKRDTLVNGQPEVNGGKKQDIGGKSHAEETRVTDVTKTSGDRDLVDATAVGDAWSIATDTVQAGDGVDGWGDGVYLVLKHASLGITVEIPIQVCMEGVVLFACTICIIRRHVGCL